MYYKESLLEDDLRIELSESKSAIEVKTKSRFNISDILMEVRTKLHSKWQKLAVLSETLKGSTLISIVTK